MILRNILNNNTKSYDTIIIEFQLISNLNKVIEKFNLKKHKIEL